ncbi:MAG TPA: TolC family protein [Balneolaceae bacterium]
MRKGILFFFGVLILPLIVQAQDVQQITLQEAIDIALENNYQLEQARNNLDLAESFVLNEKLDYAPSISGSIGASSSSGGNFIPGTDTFVSRNIKSFNASLRASIPLFQGFANINSLRSAQFDKKSQKENVEWVRESIIFQTASTYLQLLLNKELLEIARENLAASQQQLEQVEVQVKVGARPTVDLYNQQATLANNELEVTNRENALQMSRLQLISIMQVDPRKEYEFATPEISDEEIEIQRYELPTLVNTALENRSDLERERLNIESLEYQLKTIKGSLYPSLSLSASILSRYNYPNDVSFNDQFFLENVNRSIGLSLSIPIFNGFDRRLNIQAQKINYKNAKLALENTRLQVIQDVNQAYSDYQSILKQIEAAEKALQAAERSYITQKQRYEVGAGTLIELSEANAQYVQAQADYTSARYNYIFQQKILEYFIGKLGQDVQLQ